MDYWIDGYNLIRRAGWDGEGVERARERLMRCAVALDVPVRLYFDAKGAAAGRPDGVETYSQRVTAFYVRSADDAICNDLRSVKAGNVTLVTDDRELRGRARQLGATTAGVEKFIEKLKIASAPVPPPVRRAEPAPDERSKRPSKREVLDTMREMGLENFDPSTLIDPEGPPAK